PRQTSIKYPHPTPRPARQKTRCNEHSNAYWTRLQQTIPIANCILRSRFPQMHMRVSQTNTTTPPARMQILQCTTKDTTQTNETDPPHLAHGDAHGKRTTGGNGVPG